MSVNDKVKVIWKTKCQWNDRPHWPKRREIKLTNEDLASEGKELPALKPGDAVKVKFGSRWYHAEVSEHWIPRQSKKGNYLFQLLFTQRNKKHVYVNYNFNLAFLI